jgi:dihydrofolate reductase
MSAIISLVVARAANGIIGAQGRIPWRIPADMKHFKAVTMGKPCIMGRKTWECLPKKPLPGRTNIVITRDPKFRAEDAIVVHTLDDALSRAEAEAPQELAVIGGAEIYRVALTHARRIHLTEVHAHFDGDAAMPPFDLLEWNESAREDHAANEDSPAFSFVTLERC